jgi:hypothetical protein
MPTRDQIAALRLAVVSYGTACIDIGSAVGPARDRAHRAATARHAEVGRLINALIDAPDLGDVASGLVPVRLTGGWNSSSRAALEIIRRQDDEGGVA